MEYTSNFKTVILNIIILLFFGSQIAAKNLSVKLFDVNSKLVAKSNSNTIKNDSALELNIEHEFQQGDFLTIEGAKFLFIQLDENISGSYVYLQNGQLKYPIPFNEIGKNYSPLSFVGKTHKIVVRKCSKAEWSAYRNLALNPTDVRGPSEFYPHATSNSECRGESWYAARNAIDGNTANTLHGKWPYQSWGPEMLDSLWFKIDFGRKVEVDKIVIYNRAQYYDNHDSYWNKAIVEFSDGTKEEITIEKTALAQEIKLKKHITSFVRFSGLKEFEHKWSAWIEVEVFGKDTYAHLY